MPLEFGSSEGAHLITAFRAFVHDNGMPGVRMKKDDGSFVDVVFSVAGAQELQRQINEALTLASASKSRH
jgi:hypothetical protein